MEVNNSTQSIVSTVSTQTAAECADRGEEGGPLFDQCFKLMVRMSARSGNGEKQFLEVIVERKPVVFYLTSISQHDS